MVIIHEKDAYCFINVNADNLLFVINLSFLFMGCRKTILKYIIVEMLR